MAFPWTWNPTSPNAATDKVSQFPSLTFYHGDKTTLKNLLPLTDLASPSTATMGWRVRQVGNVIWITANAADASNGTVWNRDDTSKPAWAIAMDITNDLIRFYRAPAAANPITWTEGAKLSGDSILTIGDIGVGGILSGVGLGVGIAPNGAVARILAALGTITTDIKAIDITGTWNAGGVAFTGIKLNVTDTASAAASLLMDLLVGGASKAKIDKTGKMTLTGALVLPADPSAALEAATKQYVDKNVVVAKVGDGSSAYTNTTTSYADVDATNLAYAVTVPSGYTMAILVNGNVIGNTASNQLAWIAISDGVTTLAEREIIIPLSGGAGTVFSVLHLFAGDGAAHTFKLRFRCGTASQSISIYNTSTGKPQMSFLLMKTG